MEKKVTSRFIVDLVKAQVKKGNYIVDVYYKENANSHPVQYFYVNAIRNWFQTGGTFDSSVWTNACMREDIWDDFEQKYYMRDCNRVDMAKLPDTLNKVTLTIAADLTVTELIEEIRK